MISDGYEAQQTKYNFDLIPFYLESRLRMQWRRPVRLDEIDRNRRSQGLALERPAQNRMFPGELRNETKTFLGMVGMAMKGYSRPILPVDLGFVPKGKFVLGQLWSSPQLFGSEF